MSDKSLANWKEKIEKIEVKVKKIEGVKVKKKSCIILQNLQWLLSN